MKKAGTASVKGAGQYLKTILKSFREICPERVLDKSEKQLEKAPKNSRRKKRQKYRVNSEKKN